MSSQKIPDKSNFLEKFSAVEEYLKDTKKPGGQFEVKSEINTSINKASDSTASIGELKCVNCGHPRKPQDVFCSNCGYQNDPVLDVQPENVSREGILNCPNCSSPFTSENVFCENCGIRLQK